MNAGGDELFSIRFYHGCANTFLVLARYWRVDFLHWLLSDTHGSEDMFD